MAQLNLFNSGINNVLASHLIASGEAVYCENVDLSKGVLTPTKRPIAEFISLQGDYIYNFKDKWISSESYRHYAEFQEKLFYCDGVGRPQKSSDGVEWFNLGISKPMGSATISANAAGVLSGVYQYTYTYYNALDGTESQPADLSSELTVTGSSILVEGIIPSDDSQVTHIRLYRLGGALTSPQLVVELTNGTTSYLDNLSDLSIPGDVLDSYTNGPAPTGLDYITEYNAMLFGAVGDKLYFSDVAYVNYWSEFNFIDFPKRITGIGATQNGLLVFTKYQTYIVVGNSPDTLSKYLLSGSQGCISHSSVQIVAGSAVWASTDGICVSSGSSVDVVSRAKLDKKWFNDISKTILSSAVHDNQYHLVTSSCILVGDFRFGGLSWKVENPEGIAISRLHTYADELYGAYKKTLYKLYGGELQSLSYTTPNFSEGQLSNLKNYKSVYINVDGELIIGIYIDDELVHSKAVNSTDSEIKIPQAHRLGYTIQFKIEGVGTLNELYYSAEGRQNGR